MSKDPSECMILLVQGGPLLTKYLQERDRCTQAVLAIDGSIGRVSEMDLADILDNEGVRAVIAALGTGICFEGHTEIFSMLHLRYHRIVIEVEDTADGHEIKEQYLELFDTLLRPIREAGHVHT